MASMEEMLEEILELNLGNYERFLDNKLVYDGEKEQKYYGDFVVDSTHPSIDLKAYVTRVQDESFVNATEEVKYCLELKGVPKLNSRSDGPSRDIKMWEFTTNLSSDKYLDLVHGRKFAQARDAGPSQYKITWVSPTDLNNDTYLEFARGRKYAQARDRAREYFLKSHIFNDPASVQHTTATSNQSGSITESRYLIASINHFSHVCNITGRCFSGFMSREDLAHLWGKAKSVLKFVTFNRSGATIDIEQGVCKHDDAAGDILELAKFAMAVDAAGGVVLYETGSGKNSFDMLVLFLNGAFALGLALSVVGFILHRSCPRAAKIPLQLGTSFALAGFFTLLGSLFPTNLIWIPTSFGVVAVGTSIFNLFK